MIAVTTTVITGINRGRNLDQKVNLDTNFSFITQPLNWQLENKKTTAKLENQNIFQSVFLPKKNIATNRNNAESQSIPVLLYHGVTEKPDGENVTIDQFRNQLITLKKSGFQTITLEQLQKFNRGEINLPEKSFLITFDDGRKDSFYNVDPILAALNYNAVTYIITKQSTGNAHSTYYLTEEELKQIQKTGRWEIESHSKNAHDVVVIAEDGKRASFYGNKQWVFSEKRLETDEEYRSRIRKDLSDSKQDLEKALNKKVTSIALPFGDYGQNSLNFDSAPHIMKEEATRIYETVMYQTWADNFFNETLFNYPNPENKMIKRIDVKASWNQQKLLEVLTTYEDKDLPFNDNFTNDNGWIKNWGEMSIQNKSLFIGSNDKANGSLVFLSGGQNWINYSFKAYLDWLGGEDATLVARFKDSENFVSCRIGDGQVVIAERVEGEDTILTTSKKDFVLQLYGTTLEMEVNGSTVRCFVEGKEVAKTEKLSPFLNYGSIGFASWDRNPHNSAILIKNVSVEEITKE